MYQIYVISNDSCYLERGGSIGRQFGGDRGQAPTGQKVFVFL